MGPVMRNPYADGKRDTEPTEARRRLISLRSNALVRYAFRTIWRSSAEAYLRILTAYDRWVIRGRSGPRDLRRVCVVAATQRHNGISIGAQLQVEALRRAGIEAELLDATPALRNPMFRIPHEPAGAYIFHSGGPQLAGMIASVLPHATAAWRIAYWAWELPSPPRGWPEPKGLVSEIWTPSEFARGSLLSASPSLWASRLTSSCPRRPVGDETKGSLSRS